MVLQRIKDGSKIRGCMVTRKLGNGDESETREGKQGKTQRWVSIRGWGDLGKILGRSIDLGNMVFRRVGGEGNKGKKVRVRMARCPKDV